MPEQSADWLSPRAVAAEYDIGLNLLQNHRSAGTGSPYVKVGSRTVRYHRPAFVAWLASRDARAGKVRASNAVAAASRVAVERLEPLERIAGSLALQTPGGIVSEAARALARGLSGELARLCALAGEGEAA